MKNAYIKCLNGISDAEIIWANKRFMSKSEVYGWRTEMSHLLNTLPESAFESALIPQSDYEGFIDDVIDVICEDRAAYWASLDVSKSLIEQDEIDLWDDLTDTAVSGIFYLSLEINEHFAETLTKAVTYGDVGESLVYKILLACGLDAFQINDFVEVYDIHNVVVDTIQALDADEGHFTWLEFTLQFTNLLTKRVKYALRDKMPN